MVEGDVQQCMPHEILLAGWGICEGSDLGMTSCPGCRGRAVYAVGTDGLPFCWENLLVFRRQAASPDFRNFEYLLGNASLSGSSCSSSIAQQCLGFTACATSAANASASRPAQQPENSLSPPQHHRYQGTDAGDRQRIAPGDPAAAAAKPFPKSLRRPDEAFGLSDREIQIMDWSPWKPT
jgi:hypothetical protein